MGLVNTAVQATLVPVDAVVHAGDDLKIAYERNLPSSAVLRALIDLARDRPELVLEITERARAEVGE
jgi:hypothetical protein